MQDSHPGKKGSFERRCGSLRTRTHYPGPRKRFQSRYLPLIGEVEMQIGVPRRPSCRGVSTETRSRSDFRGGLVLWDLEPGDTTRDW
jgi:hypothetical protein